MSKPSKQVRVFEDEFNIVLKKAEQEQTGVQLALSIIINEWRKYDTAHRKSTTE